jgi:preprotein translocase subunit SecG
MWDILWWLMLALYVPSCVGLIVVVLLQKGKGVGFAGAFGIGSGSDAVFGPRASKSLPQKLTHIMAAIFMILAFSMSLIAGRTGKGAVPEKVSEEAVTTTQTMDANTLEDLGSGLGDAGDITVTPGAPASVPATPAPAPATPAPAPAPGSN